MKKNEYFFRPPEADSDFKTLFQMFWDHGVGHKLDDMGDPTPWTVEALVAAFDSLSRDVDPRSIENWRSGKFLPSRRNRILLAHIATRDAPQHRQAWRDAWLSAERVPVEIQEAGPTQAAPSASEIKTVSNDGAHPSSSWWKAWRLPAIVTVCAAIIGGCLYAFGPGLLWEDRSPVRIAVLEFASDDMETGERAVSSGLRNAVHHALVQFDSYEVVARRTVGAALNEYGRDAPPMVIADAVEADYLIEGELFEVDGLPRLRIQLIDTMNEVPLEAWSNVYGEGQGGLLSADIDAARDISEAVNVKLFKAGSSKMRQTGTDNLSAYLDYLRARERLKFWHEDRAAHDIELAAREFISASRHDPDWHLPRFHIADIYYHMAVGHVPVAGASSDDLPRSREGALLALRDTLDRAARLADDPGDQVQNRLNRIFFSDDSRGLAEDGRAYVETATERRGELEWLFEPVALLHLVDVELMDQLVEDRILRFDPDNGTAHAYAVRARLLSGDLQAATARLEEARATSFSNRLDEVAGYIHVSAEDFAGLEGHLMTATHLTSTLGDYFAAIHLAREAGRDRAVAYIEQSEPLARDDVQRAFAFRHVGARDRADALFSAVLSEPGGPALVQTALAYGAGCGLGPTAVLKPLLDQRAEARLPPLACMASGPSTGSAG